MSVGTWLIPLGCLVAFLAVLLLINRKNMGVSGFTDFAVTNSGFGFMAITFAFKNL